jgi:uncharacterized protein with HEPN domain
MQIEIQKYLFDIYTSINSIDEFLGDKKDYNHYVSNKQLRRAIERELEIIGEAINRLLKIDPNIKIENTRKIVDLRNLVIHGYDKIDDTIVWGVIIKEIPILKEQVKLLLQKQ